MRQGSFSYYGIAYLVILQVFLIIFGFHAVLSSPRTAIALGVFGLGGVAFLMAGLNIEIGDHTFRSFAALGYFATAVSFVGLTVLGEVWESPTNIYPDFLLIGMLFLGGVMLVRIGVDIATGGEQIVTVESRNSG
ncbi:hypothetical protein [Halomicrococcus gelatinilyticus]|uniref:hypothetical protein n=1 Tax=Halomicrococcus gelatinilyticus TaxID=1702103 RepID=UPI002E115DD3